MDAFQNIQEDVASLKDRREHPYKYRGIRTGFPKIDEATGGWIPGELTIIMAHLDMGKSILLQNFAKYAYEMRFNVIYVTVKMSIEQQKRRLFSNISNVLYQKLKRPECLVDEEIKRLETKVKKFSDCKNYLWFIDSPEKCTIKSIEEEIVKFEIDKKTNAELLIIDSVLSIKEDLSDLKIFARKLNIPILTSDNFDREDLKLFRHGKDPSWSQLSVYNKSIFCDNIIGITGSKDDAELCFLYTKDTIVPKVFLDKNFDYMRFEYSKRKNERKEVDENRFEDEEEVL